MLPSWLRDVLHHATIAGSGTVQPFADADFC